MSCLPNSLALPRSRLFECIPPTKRCNAAMRVPVTVPCRRQPRGLGHWHLEVLASFSKGLWFILVCGEL